MGIRAGLVGLPNVGKSTLFNALTRSSVPAENYPFCTIDPHEAITFVPDPRIATLAGIFGSGKRVPATVNFVDIAGLVKGAATGQGLGNQFLGHIKEVDLIIHVLRCFDNNEILHTSTNIDPIADYQIILSELILKDLEALQKRLTKLDTLIKAHQQKPAERKLLEEERALLVTLRERLDAEDRAGALAVAGHTPPIPLLCLKKQLIIANIAEHELEEKAYVHNKHYLHVVAYFGAENVIPVCAKLAAELAQMTESAADEIRSLMNVEERSLDEIIRATYDRLELITFFTCGPQEIHAWPIKRGTAIREAAGEIHSDLQRGFICADVFNYEDLATFGTEAKVRAAGRVRIEGSDYRVADGDIIHVKFNV